MSGVKKIITFFLLLSYLITFVCFFLNGYLSSLYLLTSITLLTILSYPIYKSNFVNYFSIIPYLFYFVFLNVFLRNVYLIFDLPTKEYINDVFLLNHSKYFLFKYQLITLFCFIFFILGYDLIPEVISKNNNKSVDLSKWNFKKVQIICLLYLLVSLISLIIFINSSSKSIFLITAENISGYRGISDDLTEYNANGFLRILIQFSVIVLYVSFTIYKLSKKRNVFNAIVLIISILISSFFYFYTQSRSGLLLIFINCYIISFYIGIIKKVNFKTIFILFTFVLLIFGFMTSLRSGNGYDLDENLKNSYFRIFDPIIANNGGIDVSKTAHIIEYVDSKSDFKYGKTYLWILESLVPRYFWSDKPVNIDTEVGMKIYGSTTYGTGAVPPGLIAESYWNFGFIGLFIIPFLVGILLKFISNYFNKNIKDINNLLVYVTCFMPIGLSLFGSSINSTFVGILYILLPFLLFFKFVSIPKNSKLQLD